MKPIHITSGIISVLVLIIFANIVVYQAIVYIFVLTFGLNIIKFVLIILSLGFIIAILIGRRHYNFWSRTLYLITSIWFSFFIYLFFISLIYFIILDIFNGANDIINLIWKAMVVVIVSFIFYGIINARKFYVKTVDIKLPHLPREWENRKAVWISDVHIGLVYNKQYIQKIVDKINELQPDIVFIGGDLFDGISTPSVIEFANPLRKISAPLGIYFVSGNHELYGKTSEFYKKIESLGIKRLKNEMETIEGLQLIGIEYSKVAEKDGFREILKNLKIDDSKSSILIKHEPRDLKITEKAGVNLQISGHTHNAQQWPLNYYAKIFYKKYIYGLNRLGNMQVYTSSGVATWGPSVRIGSKCEIVEFRFKNMEKQNNIGD